VNSKKGLSIEAGILESWDLNSWLHACKADALLLELFLQSIFALVLWEMVSHELFAQAGLELQSS
jgi:hypothetical protein